MVAVLLQAVGVHQVVTIDLHSPQIEGFFHVPVDSLTAVPVLAEAMRTRLPDRLAVVSPDAGRVKMATQYARQLGATVIVLHKQRESGTETHITHVVGEVRDRACLIIDDMISTGGTVLDAIEALGRAGARPGIWVAATHGLLLGGTPALLNHSNLAEVFVTDTIARPGQEHPRLRVVSVAPLIAGVIQRVMADGSLISALAGVPVKQSVAITGSVNQQGQVQPVGGINEKIEGFFDACQVRGLTGRQGVIIPAANVRHLMLRSDVVRVASSDRFRVYPVQSVDQALEVMTDLPAGQRDAQGRFPEGSINHRAETRLVELAELWRQYNRSGMEAELVHGRLRLSDNGGD